jgi:hypothetical protein
MLLVIWGAFGLKRRFALLQPYRVLCGGLILLLALRATAHAAPTVFWASDPILAGQTALLFGDGLGRDTTAVGARVPDEPVHGPERPVDFKGNLQPLTVLQASDLSAKVLLPAAWKPGLYAIRLNAGRGQTAVVYLNRAEAWWWLGGSADPTHAAPSDVALSGEILRVFGKNFGPQTRAWLVVGKQPVPIETVKAENYTVTFRLPTNVEAGEYALWVHNGYGGDYGFGKPLTIKVGQPAPWPTTRYNVRDYGARGDYVTDDTEAFHAAIDKARQNGGGIVYVPRGQYKITARLSIPARTVLRGEKREVVWLYVPKDQPEFDTVIAGNGDFAVEDLSITAQTVRRLIICPDNPALTTVLNGNPAIGSNVHLSRLRLQLLHYAHRVGKDDPRRMEMGGPTTIVLDGPDMWLQDLDMVNSGSPINMHSARRCRIENCVLGVGRGGYYNLEDFEEGVFEGNDVHADDMEGSYGGSHQNAYRLYFANNHIHDAYGDEREALIFDSPYYSTWVGIPDNARGKAFTAPGQHWKPDSLKGLACLVIGGKGLGQYRPIISNTDDTITLEYPWDVELDRTSTISVQANRTQVVLVNNHMSDASGAIMLYSQCYNFIMDGNWSERTGGFYANGWDFFNGQLQRRRYSCSYFNQWLNNHMSQGFVYDLYGFSRAILGVHVDQNALAKPIDPPHAVIALGNIMRGNQGQDQATIGTMYYRPMAANLRLDLDYVGRDTIIEDNTVTDSDVGITIARYFIDSLVRNNQIKRCTTPIEDHGTGTLVR